MRDKPSYLLNAFATQVKTPFLTNQNKNLMFNRLSFINTNLSGSGVNCSSINLKQLDELLLVAYIFYSSFSVYTVTQSYA
jgi:hypothetical protein